MAKTLLVHILLLLIVTFTAPSLPNMTRHRNSPRARASLRVRKKSRSIMKAIISMGVFKDLITLSELEDAELAGTLLPYIEKLKISSGRQAAAAKRVFRQRKSWTEFQSRLTDRQFRRYFRMTRECFNLLCRRIEDSVGAAEFKSEDYLNYLKQSSDPADEKMAQMMRAHEGSTGGFISGEVKLALTLRLLAGGSYLDLALLLECGSSSAYKIFHHVVQNWICNKSNPIVKISGIEYVNDDEKMEQFALEFARKSGGLFSGCIGAIDGWIVKIRK